MNNSAIGLVAIVASVCSSAGAATLDVSVTGDLASQFTYTAKILRNDSVAIDQFQFAFNTPDTAASISNVLNPFGWTSAIESAADSGWRYSAADDVNSGDYGLSAGSFDMPAAVLSFRFDVVGQAAAVQSVQQTALAVGNAERSAMTAEDRIVALDATLPALQASLDEAQADVAAAAPIVQTAKIAFEATVRVQERRYIDFLIRKEGEAREAYLRNPTAETEEALELAIEARLNGTPTFRSSDAYLDALATYDAVRDPFAVLEADLADKSAAYNMAAEELAAAKLAQQDAINDLADLRILAADALAELARYTDGAGGELGGFSYMSTFGPISGPALLSGPSENQTVGVLVAGEATMSAVPLPASTLFLLTGLAGFGALRRRQVKRVVS